jgi:hypothetical protein
MSLNKDDAVIQSFIDMAQKNILTTFDDIKANILQTSDSCTSAQECSDKINAIISAIPDHPQTLINTLSSQAETIINQNPKYNEILPIIQYCIVENYTKAFPVLKYTLSGYSEEIVDLSGYPGDEVFPYRMKDELIRLLAPVYTASSLFFGWLEGQPTPSIVTG